MPASVVHTPHEEKLWERAKNAVERSKLKKHTKFNDQDWGLVMHIFQGMKKKEAKSALVAELGKLGIPVVGELVRKSEIKVALAANPRILRDRKQFVKITGLINSSRKLKGLGIDDILEDGVVEATPKNLARLKEVVRDNPEYHIMTTRKHKVWYPIDNKISSRNALYYYLGNGSKENVTLIEDWE